MTTTQLSVFGQLDATLDQIVQARAEAVAQPGGVRRCLRLAELAETEAAWWEELSEHSPTRVYWRAALAAREQARQTARHWRVQAATLAVAATQPAARSGAV